MKIQVAICCLLLPAAVSAQRPAITGGIVNAAGFLPGPVAPGSLVSIFGVNFSATRAAAIGTPLPTSLGDIVLVTFDGLPGRLLFVSDTQINAQVPWELGPGVVSVVVTRGDSVSPPSPLVLSAAAPGVFAVPVETPLPIPRFLAAAAHAETFLLAQPSGALPDVQSEPVRRGQPLAIFATGLGRVFPPIRTGEDSSDEPRRTLLNPVVTVGGVRAQVLFSGLAPAFVGVNQINIRVPGAVQPGEAVPLQIQLDDIVTSAFVTIAVQ